MRKKKLMSVSLLFLSFCIEWQVCSCVRPGTRDKEKHEEPQSLQGASTSGQRATSPPFNNTSLEGRPEGQPRIDVVSPPSLPLLPQHKNVSTDWQPLCEHYVRRCEVQFSCCQEFYPCHLCHNKLRNCEKAKGRDATHLKCSLCQSKQEIDEKSDVCRGCGAKMAAYFCLICKHFARLLEKPYHCDQCGICRVGKAKSFHCEGCSVCMDKRLENKHKCRPDSGNEECFICKENTFSGSSILHCLHKVHRDCLGKMIQSGIKECPLCLSPLRIGSTL